MSGFWYRIGSLYPLSLNLAVHAALVERTVIFRNMSVEAPIREVEVSYLGFAADEVSDFFIHIRPSRLFAHELLNVYAIFYNIDPNTDSTVKAGLLKKTNGCVSFNISSDEYSSFISLIKFIEFLCQHGKAKNFLVDVIAEFRQIAKLIRAKINAQAFSPVHLIPEKLIAEKNEPTNQLLFLLQDIKFIYLKMQVSILKRHVSKTAFIDESEVDADYHNLCDVFPILAQEFLQALCDDMDGISPPPVEHKEQDETELLAKMELEAQMLNRKFDQLLVMAERVNAFDSTGYTPLHYALFLTVEEVEKLLQYGANPVFLAPHQGTHYITAYELALQQAEQGRGIEMFQLLQSSMLHVERALKKPAARLIFEDIRIEPIYHGVKTTFVSSQHGVIFTELKPYKYLASRAKEQLLALFNENFAGEKEFKEDLNSDNIYAELFYAYSPVGNQPIGFNVFRIFEIDKQIVLNCAYSALIKKYRGFSLMPLLIFRLTFVLDHLFPDRKVSAYFNAIHYNSYRLIENLLHWPKYQSPAVEELLKKIFTEIDENPRYEHDIMKCFVADNVKVKDDYYTKEKTHLGQKHFYERILAFANGEPAYPRAAPVIFYAGVDSFDKFSRLLADIGVDLESHVRSFSQHFASLVPFKPAVKRDLLQPYVAKHSAQLFFLKSCKFKKVKKSLVINSHLNQVQSSL